MSLVSSGIITSSAHSFCLKTQFQDRAAKKKKKKKNQPDQTSQVLPRTDKPIKLKRVSKLIIMKYPKRAEDKRHLCPPLETPVSYEDNLR